MGGIEGQLVIALSVLVLAWYIVGQQRMRRRGMALLQWVRPGVAALGEEPKLQWLGGSAFRVTMARPAWPFRALTLTVVLEPREILFLWLVNRLRRRCDLLVVRGDLSRRPRLMLELFRNQGRSGAEAQAMVAAAQWPSEPFDPSGLRLATPSPGGREALQAATRVLQGQLSALMRLSVRDTSPHILLNYALRPGHEGEVGAVFRCLMETAQAALGERAGHPPP
jgi:hypothetical protein